jgi:hypothetical protein
MYGIIRVKQLKVNFFDLEAQLAYSVDQLKDREELEVLVHFTAPWLDLD